MEVYQDKWWVLVVRGILAILIGLAALFIPEITLGVFVILFAAFLIADGLLSILFGITHHLQWMLVIEGVLLILLGGLVAFMPGITLVFVAYIIAAWGIISGISRIIQGIQLRREVHEWAYIATGILLVLFGGAIVLYPLSGLIALTQVFGIFELVVGLLLVFAALQFHSGQIHRQAHV